MGLRTFILKTSFNKDCEIGSMSEFGSVTPPDPADGVEVRTVFIVPSMLLADFF